MCAYTFLLLDKSERQLSIKSQQAQEAHTTTITAIASRSSKDTCRSDVTVTAINTAVTITVASTDEPSINVSNLPPTPLPPKLSYPTIGALAFPHLTCTICRQQVNIVESIIYFGIVATSVGVSAAYTNFIAETVSHMFEPSPPESLSAAKTSSNNQITYFEYQLMVFPFIICLSLLKNYSMLAKTSLVGDVAVAGALLCVIIYGASVNTYDLAHVISEAPVVRWTAVPEYIGRAAFVFAIHMSILPIMHNMTHRQTQFKPTTYASYSCITVVNLLFGFFGYLLFAGETCRSVASTTDSAAACLGPCSNILDSVHGNKLLHTVRIFLCVDLLFSVPIALGRHLNNCCACRLHNTFFCFVFVNSIVYFCS